MLAACAYWYRLLLPIGWRVYANFTPTPEKTKTTLSAIQAASQSTFMNAKLYSNYDYQE
jgi:hypothetical protein